MRTPSRRFPVRSLLIAALVAAVALPAWAREDRSKPPAWDPDVAAPGAPPFLDGAWVVEDAAYRARLRPVTDAGRLEFIRQSTGLDIDPFAVRPSDETVFVSYVLEVESRSPAVLTLEPQGCLLVAPDRELRTPLDLASIQTVYAMMDREMPPAYEKARPALLDGTVFLRPGERREGLVVYRVPRSLKRFHVGVALTTAAGARIGFEAPHRLAKRPKGTP